MRGSTDFHAWGDVTAYLHRDRDGVLLTVKHRSAPSPEPVRVELDEADPPALRLVDGERAPQQDDLATRLLEALAHHRRPLSQNRLRDLVQARKSEVGKTLKRLEELGQIQRTSAGWATTEDQQSSLPL